MTDCMNMDDRTVRKNDPVIGFELRLVTSRLFEKFTHSGLILRMKPPKKIVEQRRARGRIETKHAITFRGPIPDFTCRGGPRPTSGVAEALRFCQVGFAFALSR